MSRLAFRYNFGRDLHHAFRALTGSPAFAVTALITLALVIGANTTVFSLVDSILIKPLPYPEPERLAYVDVAGRTVRGEDTIERHDGTTWEVLRDGVTAIDVAAHGSGLGRDVNLSADGVASLVGEERVSAGFFRVLGIAPLFGREFAPDEDRPGGPAVVALSYGLWQRLFDGDESAIGETILLRGEPYQVVGVMPQGFRSIERNADVWTPLRPSRTGEGLGTNYRIIARVGEGYTWPEALAAMPPLDDDYFRRLMGSDWADARPTGRFSLVPMQQVLTRGAETPLLMLVAATGILLLIACVNLAALLLSRAGSRTREIATRMALGSGRGKVVLQLFTENLVLGAIGGVLGFLVGYAGLAALKNIGASTYGQWADVTLDGRAFTVTIGLAFVTSVLFGLLPAIQASRLDLNAALNAGAARSVVGGSRHWGRRVLVGTEIALGVVLLVLTGLLIRAFVNLQSLDPGFDASQVTTASVSLQDARYDTAASMNRLFDESLRRLETTPGIESAAVSLELPYRQLLNMNFAFADEVTPTGPRIANLMYATPGLFETLRIPLRAGRLPADTDTPSSSPVVVVSQDFVDLLANGENPVGRRIRLAGVEREIVGVVGNVRITEAGFSVPGMSSAPLRSSPLVYLPAAQTPDGLMGAHVWFSPMWTVRARDMGLAERTLGEAIIAADPLLPVGSVRRMSEIRAEATAEQRLLMILVGVIAAAALALSAVGIYGLIAHAVGERRREFGMRMALGATAGQTVRSVALSGIALAGVGACVGIGLALMAARVLDSQSILFGVGSRDPVTFVGVAVFLLTVAAVASVVPALRILRLDPARALRDQ